MFGIRPTDRGAPTTTKLESSTAPSKSSRRDEADDAYTRCVSSGAEIHSPPEEHRGEARYYAFFAFDPDRIRVEVFCWTRADTTP